MVLGPAVVVTRVAALAEVIHLVFFVVFFACFQVTVIGEGGSDFARPAVLFSSSRLCKLRIECSLPFVCVSCGLSDEFRFTPCVTLALGRA